MTGAGGDLHSGAQIAELPSFNTPEYFADPYSTLSRIREVGPVLRIESPPHWFVTGYEPGEQVLRHPAALAEGFARRQRAIRSRYGDRFDPLIEVVRLHGAIYQLSKAGVPSDAATRSGRARRAATTSPPDLSRLSA